MEDVDDGCGSRRVLCDDIKKNKRARAHIRMGSRAILQEYGKDVQIEP